MKITALTENTSVSPKFAHVHGLSFYIETKKHKILFDMGPDDTFIKNAQLLGIKLSEVDVAFISHGHNDHGGALKLFTDINKTAKIYVRENIFDRHYAVHGESIDEIGLDKTFAENERIIFVKDSLKIDDELFVFSAVRGRKYFSEANKTLYAEINGEKITDDFTHEQNLIITTEGKTVMIGGCAHNGIVNIMEKAHEILGKAPDVVVSGFHLMNPDAGKSESGDLVYGVASELMKFNSKYYTCHCTGLESYGRLKEVMGDRTDYIAAGQSLEF